MIAIIDYGMGNAASVLNMFRKIGLPAVVSRDASTIADAKKLVLPGVGAFDHGMRNLRQTALLPVLERRVLEAGVPILGICLGLQLMTLGSEEGESEGLGWLRAWTVRFRFTALEDMDLKIPHMGWKGVQTRSNGKDWPSLADRSRFYFAHSYHLDCRDEDDIVATALHGYEFPAVVAHANVNGTQFHPEKSHRFGMALLRDFAERR